MTRPIDAHHALESALTEALGRQETQLLTNWSRPWASVTFSGARHIWEFQKTSPAAWDETAISTLSSHEFSLRGHIVADLVASLVGDILRIEALTVEVA